MADRERQPRYGTVDTAYGAALASAPDDAGPVWMVNLMRYRDRADYADGRETGLTGREADAAYAPLDQLAAVGAEVVFVADVEDQLLGDETVWDRVAIVKYPTPRAFLELQSQPGFREQHAHKDAGLERTIVIGCSPIDMQGINDDRVPFDQVPHPPTEDDGEVVVVHVIRFHDGAAGTPDEMVAYQEQAIAVARPHGAYLDGWLQAGGTIVGDGRRWHQVRFNHFPSKEAFMAVVFDPRRLEAQKGHREEAIADTYTMITRPTINRLAESIGLRV